MNKRRSLLLSAISMSLLATSAYGATPAATPTLEILTSSLKEIMNQHVSSFPAPVAVEKKPKLDSEKTLWERLSHQEEPTFTINPLCKYEEIGLSYNLMGRQLSAMMEGVLHQKCTKDLEIFCGANKREINLLQLFNKTHSPEGEVYLGALLSHPVTDIQTLENRQAVIRTLTGNAALLNHLNKLYADLAEHHSTLVSFWGTEQQSTKNFVDMQYWSMKGFTSLNTNILYQHTAMAFNLLLQPLSVVLPHAAMNWAYFSNFKPSEYTNPAVLTGAAAINLYALLPAYIMYDNVQKLIKSLNYLHEKSIGVAKMVTTIDTIHKHIQMHPEFEHLQHGEILSDFARTRVVFSSKMKDLLPLLRTNTFKGKPALMALQGRVRKAYALITEIKEELLPALVALAELDAYLSCANLYKEYEGKENGFNFATYLEQDTPYINMQTMWNPFVGADKSIANSVELGANNPLNIILTGPNAGGKSTFAKGLTLNILLAQTIGIVPARSLTFTPFSKINTYMNISDDTAGGNSLFKSEVMRAQELLNIINNLPKNQFSFCVMDEMFSGTSPKEGEAASYAVANNIGSNKNSIAIIATHYPLMKELESVTKNFKNYQVRVVRHDDGTFSYPFKLEEGAADQNVAIDILKQEGFESSILAEAHAILNRPQAAATA